MCIYIHIYIYTHTYVSPHKSCFTTPCNSRHPTHAAPDACPHPQRQTWHSHAPPHCGGILTCEAKRLYRPPGSGKNWAVKLQESPRDRSTNAGFGLFCSYHMITGVNLLKIDRNRLGSNRPNRSKPASKVYEIPCMYNRRNHPGHSSYVHIEGLPADLPCYGSWCFQIASVAARSLNYAQRLISKWGSSQKPPDTGPKIHPKLIMFQYASWAIRHVSIQGIPSDSADEFV